MSKERWTIIEKDGKYIAHDREEEVSVEIDFSSAEFPEITFKNPFQVSTIDLMSLYTQVTDIWLDLKTEEIQKVKS